MNKADSIHQRLFNSQINQTSFTTCSQYGELVKSNNGKPGNISQDGACFPGCGGAAAFSPGIVQGEEKDICNALEKREQSHA